MANLKTKYLGIDLKNPLVASASALSKKLSNIKKMEDAGISAVVLYSLFEEEIEQDEKQFSPIFVLLLNMFLSLTKEGN